MPEFDDWIADFVGPDEDRAKRGFERLTKPLLPGLERFFRTRNMPRESAEDLSVEVFVKLWRNRRSFKPQGENAWRSYVNAVARNCLLDLVREKRVRIDEVEVEDFDAFRIEADAEGRPDTSLDRRLNRETLYDLADRHWFDWPRELSTNERNRRILAAKLIVIDKMPWRNVCRLLHVHNERGEPDADSLMQWLAGDAVYLQTAFDELWLDIPDIMQAIEGVLDRPLDGEEREWINRRLAGTQISEEKIALADRWASLLPFLTVMESLCRALEGHRTGLSQSLKTEGLWKRLVFQYHAHDELPHQNILERVAPPAAYISVKIDGVKLQNWLSGNRLSRELTAALVRENTK